MGLEETWDKRDKSFWHIGLGQTKKLEEVKRTIEYAEAIVVGAGSGLSTAAGFTYSGSRFQAHFHDFIEKYNMRDMYSAGFYPFQTQEEKWAYWSRHIYYNRYDQPAAKVYLDLFEFLKDKNYFVLTTNVDHQFLLAGFPNKRVFATQGDYGLFQCAKACHKKLYDNERSVRDMLAHQRNCKIPSNLIPKCPVCGGNMEVNLRCDEYFVEDEAWHETKERYQEFLQKNQEKHVVFLELGVGMNTPSIIKYPFWQMTYQNPNAVYICVNLNAAFAPSEISEHSICIEEDIGQVLDILKERGKIE